MSAGPPGARVLVLNAGSSSWKLRVVGPGDSIEAARDLHHRGHETDEVADFVQDAGRVDVVGHRVVHGGDRFLAPVVVNEAVRAALDEVSALAPLHNPPALAGIDAAAKALPGVPSVACFDTAFHASLPRDATTYALPAEWVDRWGLRRYGFHGLSCAWALRRAALMVGRPAAELRVVVCHVGAGASVTAIAGGRSVDTTMGFTPLEGLVMNTRPGDVDPGALAWAVRRGLDPSELDDGLEHRSGLLGLSRGRTSDTRDLLAARETGDETATVALAVYVRRLRAKIAAMTAAAGGLDVLVFSGGVGEHSSVLRGEACAGLGWMGVALDPDANGAVGDDDADISAVSAVSAPGRSATVRTLVVHAREELTIADECRRLVEGLER